jgi:hypothetical protein
VRLNLPSCAPWIGGGGLPWGVTGRRPILRLPPRIFNTVQEERAVGVSRADRCSQNVEQEQSTTVTTTETRIGPRHRSRLE